MLLGILFTLSWTQKHQYGFENDALLSWFCHTNRMKIVIEITTLGEICQIRSFF